MVYANIFILHLRMCYIYKIDNKKGDPVFTILIVLPNLMEWKYSVT